MKILAKRWMPMFTIIFLFSSFLLYQNCAESVNFDTQVASSSNPNIPREDPPGETCVEGKKLAIWLDPDKSAQPKLENYLGSIVSYSGGETAVTNYDYYSVSAHPRIGPTPTGYELHVFFYEGSDGLALNFYANVDDGGSIDNTLDININTMNNNNIDDVLLSDDNGELFRTNVNAGLNQYQGRFHYWSNTDGGVIGPFNGEDYLIQVEMLGSGDITDARFYSADGSSFTLQKDNKITSFIIGFYKIESCSSSPIK